MNTDVTQAIEAAARLDAREFAMLFPDEKPSDGWVSEAYARAASGAEWPQESRALYRSTFLVAVAKDNLDPEQR